MNSSLLILVVLCSQLVAPGDKDDLAHIFKEGDAQRPGAIKAVKQMLINEQSTLTNARKGKYMSGGFLTEFRTDDEKRIAITECQKNITDMKKRIKELEDKSIPIVPDILDRPVSGDIGHISFGGKIRQRLSDSEALVDVSFQTKVSQQFATSVTNEYLVYCKGFNFKNAADGNGYQFGGPVKITGTKTYKTALGTNTVPVMESISMSVEIKAERDKRKKK